MTTSYWRSVQMTTQKAQQGDHGGRKHRQCFEPFVFFTSESSQFPRSNHHHETDGSQDRGYPQAEEYNEPHTVSKTSESQGQQKNNERRRALYTAPLVASAPWEVVEMIRPYFYRRMWGTAACIAYRAPKTCTAMKRSNSPSSRSSIRFGDPMPAWRIALDRS